MFGMEAWVGVQDTLKAVQQQSGTDKQHHGKRYFYDDQRCSEALMVAAQLEGESGRSL